jgi:membrane protein YqaA with SNARE-associated domain
MTTLAAYLGLFITAFISATIFPMQSEAVFFAAVYSGKYSVPLLLATATLGNTLGAGVNWWLGRGIDRFRNHKWFPANEAQMSRAQNWYKRWGRWSLLLAWLPFGGDALTVVAGIMREPLPSFLAIVGVGKLARYLGVLGLYWFYPAV